MVTYRRRRLSTTGRRQSRQLRDCEVDPDVSGAALRRVEPRTHRGQKRMTTRSLDLPAPPMVNRARPPGRKKLIALFRRSGEPRAKGPQLALTKLRSPPWGSTLRNHGTLLYLTSTAAAEPGRTSTEPGFAELAEELASF